MEKQFDAMDMLEAIHWGRLDSIANLLKKTPLKDGAEFIKQLLKAKEEKCKTGK